jgi:hypothetical protein
LALLGLVTAGLGLALRSCCSGLERKMKHVNDWQTAHHLRDLVYAGKARVIKKYVDGNPELFIRSPSGTLMGIAGCCYRYLFEALLANHGSGDGLLDGFHQTTAPRP